MTTSFPHVIRITPGSTPQVEAGFPVSVVGASLSTVRLALSAAVEGDYRSYWTALQQSQSFFDRPVPSTSDLDIAIETFRTGIGANAGATTATVMLGVDSTIFVSGRSIDLSARTGASLAVLAPDQDALSPRSDWQRQALTTNSRATFDAFERLLNAGGHRDAVVEREDGTVSPVLGLLVLHIRGGFRAASATTVVPELLGALIESSTLRPRDQVAISEHLTRSDLEAADSAWWISPEFEVWDVNEIGGRALPRTRAFADYFDFL